ncbi:MerR family transcriptional regulator [Enterococcus florum]|uniref:MerR family transcriptional regulator n=1 Tax=Enterococcus florum TaxID=2480627 RepID=A0A4P5PFD2_9ENTE|nr:MerR family transcriptional regulator [Enterococcus florum]GCF95091.1 MerR family transcriptional regulator [Enterococcus florum]
MPYYTSEVAKMVSLHPNTIRKYEEWALIPKPERAANGYRLFTDYHVELIQLARIAFQIEVLQSGLRREMAEMIKKLATYDFAGAKEGIQHYQALADLEVARAYEAIAIVEDLLSGDTAAQTLSLTRSQAAESLGVTVDALRNWELNGLLQIKRSVNGYRIYTSEDLRRLKVIRTLRSANYSLEAILRLLLTLEQQKNASIEKVLDTPHPDEDIIAVCDRLLTSLAKAKENAVVIEQRIASLENTYRKEQKSDR